MESAALQRPPALSGLVQAGLVVLLLLLAAIGWAVTGERMEGMDAGPGTDLGGLGWFMGVWVTMMAAMMLPSVAPMVLMFARFQESEGRSAAAGATPLFVAGYLVTWAAAGLVGYAIVESVRSLDLGFLSWEEGGPYVAGGVIVGAGLYQLTALKDACLRNCRSPLSFFSGRWRPGRARALRMGVEHGGYCIGCCWALMAALLALGVMSVGWMALVAALIAAEKLLPWRAAASRGLAVLLAALGLAVAFAPAKVPGLTIPGSEAMDEMGTANRHANAS